MTGFDRAAYAAQFTYPAAYEQEQFTPLELQAGERIGTPVRRRRGRLVRRGLVVLAAAGAGWLHYTDPARLPALWSAASTTAAPLLERALHYLPSPSAPAATPPVEAKAPEPLPERKLVESPVLPPPQQPASPIVTGALPAAKEPPPAATAPPPAPPPAADAAKPVEPRPPSTDPQQVRAEAAGLHPDISRALLAMMSETDYRNAATAIRKAIAETADDAELIWPREAKGGIAVFKVHFVAGAAAQCRRYVVTVAKSGWLTTALPMEKCGVQRTAAKRT